MNNMEATRALFAHELVAEGKAEGKAEGITIGAQIAILFMQKKTPAEISKELGIPAESIADILKGLGLVAQTQ